MNKGLYGVPFGPIQRAKDMTSVTVSNTVTESLLVALPLPPNILREGGTARFIVWGDWLHNNVNADSVTIICRLGSNPASATEGAGVSMVTFANQNQLSASRGDATFITDLLFLGDGLVLPDGNWNMHRTDNQASQGALPSTATSGGVPASLAGQHVTHAKLTVTWSAASANNDVRKLGAVMLVDPATYRIT